jgi:periplasmic protein TonB
MSDVMVVDGFGFEAMLDGLLRERVMVAAPGGLEQRLLARLAQEEERRPFAFAEQIAVRRSSASLWFAVGAHAVVIAVVGFVVANHVAVTAPKKMVMLTTVTAPPPPRVAPKLTAMGGGGGQHDLAPVTVGHLPKFAETQIVPPKAPPMIAPKLAVEPTVMVQPDLKMATNTMPMIGSPTSNLKGFSMGNGNGPGIGSGNGAGIGPGSGGGIGGGVMHIGGGVKPPMVLKQVEPEFSEEARKAKFSGNVEVYLWVDEQGNPSHVQVTRGVGMGLDQKAVEAVKQYKFKPATKDGKPVKVDLYVDVNFTIF